MAGTALISAVFMLLCMTVGFVVIILASDIKNKSRILRHNTAHALQSLQIALDRISAGQLDAAETGKQVLSAMKAWVQPIGTQKVHLKPYLKPLVSTYKAIEFYALANPEVEVDVGELLAITVNATVNAIEARQAAIAERPNRDGAIEEQITFQLTESALRISNPASQADRAQIQKPSGSTRGPGRGDGLKSIRDSCSRIGWGVAWEVAGGRVVTTLSFG